MKQPKAQQHSMSHAFNVGMRLPQSGNNILVCLMVLGGLGFASANGYFPSMLMPLAVVIVAFYWVIRAMGYGQAYLDGREAAKRDLLTRWTKAGGAEHEQERRQFLAQHETLNDALAAAGMSAAITAPLVNIDGTPMFGDVDAKGNPYGVVEMFSSGDVGGPAGFQDAHDGLGHGMGHGSPSTGGFGHD